MIKGSWETVCSAFIIHIHHFHSSLILLLPPWILAERVGFEPTERFPVHSISSAANSTTLAPLPGIADLQLPIADFKKQCKLLRNRQSAIGNRKSKVVAERVGFEP